jgi:hypothetical protein
VKQNFANRRDVAADPEGEELQAQMVDLVESTQYEVYMPEDWP